MEKSLPVRTGISLRIRWIYSLQRAFVVEAPLFALRRPTVSARVPTEATGYRISLRESSTLKYAAANGMLPFYLSGVVFFATQSRLAGILKGTER